MNIFLPHIFNNINRPLNHISRATSCPESNKKVFSKLYHLLPHIHVVSMPAAVAHKAKASGHTVK